MVHKEAWRTLFLYLGLLVSGVPSLVESFHSGNPWRSLDCQRSDVQTAVRQFPLYTVVDDTISLSESTKNLDDMIQSPQLVTKQTVCSIEKNVTTRWSLFRNTRRIEQKLKFTLQYDQLSLGESNNSKTGILFIHPIGVGIAKWFYSRLLKAMSLLYSDKKSADDLLIIVPDLLGSGSACNPTSDGRDIHKLPLLNLTDWSDEIVSVMSEVQEQNPSITKWCLVANGGCSPIALQAAARNLEDSTGSSSVNVTNVILSSVPRLPFFTRPSNEPTKVAKSYKTLCGVVGKLFWWYSCRKDGKFIKKFSEKNLVADPNNLGHLWPKNCVETAKAHNGRSRFSTFAFLAGALQDGCSASLNTLQNSHVQIDVIKGRDVRRNRAKSWFWSKTKRKPASETTTEPRTSIRDLLEENGNGGREFLIGGRISLAHEDPYGYANAIYDFLG